VTPGILIRLKGTRIDMDDPRFLLDSNILIDTLNRKLDLLAFLDTLSAIILNATVLSNDPHLRDYRRLGYMARPCSMSA
jgi:hypothetical protein